MDIAIMITAAMYIHPFWGVMCHVGYSGLFQDCDGGNLVPRPVYQRAGSGALWTCVGRVMRGGRGGGGLLELGDSGSGRGTSALKS